jgi:hypothetical protein
MFPKALMKKLPEAPAFWSASEAVYIKFGSAQSSLFIVAYKSLVPKFLTKNL